MARLWKAIEKWSVGRWIEVFLYQKPGEIFRQCRWTHIQIEAKVMSTKKGENFIELRNSFTLKSNHAVPPSSTWYGVRCIGGGNAKLLQMHIERIARLLLNGPRTSNLRGEESILYTMRKGLCQNGELHVNTSFSLIVPYLPFIDVEFEELPEDDEV